MTPERSALAPTVEDAEAVWTSALWRGIGRMIDRAPSLAAIRAHRLELLALARWRAIGRSIAPALLEEGRLVTLRALATPVLLKSVRAACDGPIVLLKGPEAASCYPSPSLRPYGDIDLLVPDAERVQRSLVAAGFVPVGDLRVYTGIHHLQPLHLEGLPLVVEIHSRPKWPDGLQPPPLEELVECAVGTAIGVEGILALPRMQHALAIAAHNWAHQPLGRLFGVIDVAAVSEGVPERELDAIARSWGLRRIWRLTSRVVDALFLDARPPVPLRVWGRSLVDVRERTVLETHLQRWIASFSALPPHAAAAAAVRAVGGDLRPVPGERWSTKLARSRLAIANATMPRSEHEAEVESELARREAERR